jgi:exodeoxyribonuclease VII small subunit
MTGARRKSVDLEKSLAELESLVEQLEAGEQPLEQALRDFERGVRLSRDCDAALKAAEQRVQILLGGELEDFAAGDPPGEADDDEPPEGPGDDD